MKNIPPPISTAQSSADHTNAHDTFQPFLNRGTTPSHATQQTPTTLFSDCEIAPSEAYTKVVDPERRKLVAILLMFVVVTPLIFRYGCGSSGLPGKDSTTIQWASAIDPWEWAVLVVLWLGVLGSIFRLLPMVAGRPAAVESSQKCTLDGVAALGLCSPFSSEDDAILLRSLLGRTCTALHTVGSRHSIQGLYLDAILNERRIKGEANRRNCWIAWMKFLHAIVDVVMLMKEENKVDEDFPMSPPRPNDLTCASTDSPTPHRALYVQGIMGPRGLSATTPRVRQRSASSTGGMTPSHRVTFKDLGAAIDSTRTVNDVQRSALRTWSRDGYSHPLSAAMAAASPLRTGTIASPAGPTGGDHQGYLSSFSEDSGDFRGSPERPLRYDHHHLQQHQHQHHGLEQIVEQLEDEEDTESPDNQLLDFYHGKAPASTIAAPTSADLQLRSGSGDVEMGPLHRNDSYDVVASERDDTFDFDANERGARMRSPKRLSAASSSPRAAAYTSVGAGAGAAEAAPPSMTQQLFNTISTLRIDVLGLQTGAGDSGKHSGVPSAGIPSLGRQSSFTGHTPVVNFVIAPTPRARAISPRQSSIAAAYTRPHGLPNLSLNMADLVPLIDFLDAWLDEMKENEWTYDDHNPRGALEKLFFACPFMSHFQGQHMLAVHAALDTLYEAFTTTVKDEPDPKLPFHPDEVSEVEWVLHRENLPSWTVIWSYASRARLREMKRTATDDPLGPDPVYQSTRIKPGAIVYRRAPQDVMAEYAPMVYFRTRRMMYKVDYLASGAGGKTMAYLYEFCPAQRSAPDVENGSKPTRFSPRPNGGKETTSDRSVADKHVIIPLDELVLLEKNRGKTGALNFFNDYLRAKAFKWGRALGMKHPVQTFTGIVDARHALVETDVFWNDALPYFSKVETTSLPGKRFGSLSEHSICITVQYPQFFTNIGDDDVLDNSNSTYYNLWQTLRDGAKCICSSGTNAIWDISNPTFEFCTTSRSEDLGTSHAFIPHCAAVYLCINVALGIAKKTEDFLEALYRWSAGPLELLWPSFFQPKFLWHYVRVAIPTGIFALASFHENAWWYYVQLFMTLAFIVAAILDRRAGRKPLRAFTVSTVICINHFIVCSNLMSIMWYVIFPVRIAFYGVLPMGRTDQQGLFWGWISILVSFPTGIIHDSLIKMARHTAPATKEMNYHKCLWRGGQLYANSFMFTLLATIAGSYSAFKAWAWDYDLSMWSSFRIADSEFGKLTKSVEGVPWCSTKFLYFLYQYAVLYVNSCLAALTMPTVMTKWYVTFTFLLQLVCIVVSTFFVNRDKIVHLAVVLFTCSLNVLMIVEVALLLQPAFKVPIGFPFRSEYIFALMGFIIVVSALVNGALSIDTIASRVRLDV